METHRKKTHHNRTIHGTCRGGLYAIPESHYDFDLSVDGHRADKEGGVFTEGSVDHDTAEISDLDNYRRHSLDTKQ